MDPMALLLLGLAIFNCVAGDGNATTEQEVKKLSCIYPNENCTERNINPEEAAGSIPVEDAGGSGTPVVDDHGWGTGDGTTGWRRGGHFSKCPEDHKYYCVKGRCRYVVAEQSPACICEKGYTGARCDRLDLFYLRGDQGQIVVVSLIAVMVILIILIAFICICTHYCRKKRRKRKEEEMRTFDKGLPVKTEDILETNIV